MPHELPQLPFAMDSLAPHISRETIEYHYGKHHAAYVAKLNELLPDSGFENADLEDIVRKASGAIFNNAAQIWNHTFYWNCLSPDGGGAPSGAIGEAIEAGFGGYEKFKEEFTKAAVGHFGSGWAWLVKDPDGNLDIMTTRDAETPLASRNTPLLTCDVWEHAYYVDYRNARPKYIEAFWHVINWDHASSCLG